MSLRIVLHQVGHVGHGAFAEAAIVIEELDHRDVALRIAERDLARRGEDNLRVLLDTLAMLLGIGQVLALLQLGHDLLQQLRMVHQVVADDGFDLAALGGRERLRLRLRRQRQRQGQHDAENGGGKRTKVH